jgi:hypothetical protein
MKRRKNQPSSSPEKYKRFKKRKFQEGSMDKKSGNKKKNSRKAKEGPALVVKNYRMERESRSVKRKKQKKMNKDIKTDMVKMDKEVKNAVDVVNSLQVFGTEINNKSRARPKGESKKNKSTRNAPRTNYFNSRKN